MDTYSSLSNIDERRNFTEEELKELEKVWDRENKTMARRRYLRYYYRNRERFLVKKRVSDRLRDNRTARYIFIEDEDVEKVDKRRGLIT